MMSSRMWRNNSFELLDDSVENCLYCFTCSVGIDCSVIRLCRSNIVAYT